MKTNILMLCLMLICFLAVSYATADVDQVWKDGSGVWQTLNTNIGDTYYNSIAGDRVMNTRYYIADTEGGIDTIWYSGGWQKGVVVNTGQYVALATSHIQYNMFAAKTTGGIDQIWNDGSSWKSQSIFATNTIYVALTFDKIETSSFRGYAAKNDGGIDTFWDSGSGTSWQIQSYNPNDTTEYKALAAKSDEGFILYAAAKPGGIYRINCSNGTRSLISSTFGLIYTSLAIDSINSSYGESWIYGTRPNGVVDKIYVVGGSGKWVITTVADTDAVYYGLATNSKYTDNLVGIQDNQPILCFDFSDFAVFSQDWLKCSNPQSDDGVYVY